MLDTDMAKFVRDEIAAKTDPFQLLVVESVQVNGTVNLQWGSDVLTGIPCNQSYARRKSGDVVLVIRHSGGWRVIDKIGNEHTVEFPNIPDLAFGTAQPSGGGWVKAEAIWVKAGALYVQTGVGPGLPGQVGAHSASVPLPTVIKPADRAGYRSGLRVGTEVYQGPPTEGADPWTGAFFYGNGIADACTGKTVNTMAIELVRSPEPHGIPESATTRLAAHSEVEAPVTTPEVDMDWVGPNVGIGSAEWAEIPQDVVDSLIDGSRLGLAVRAELVRDYIAYAECGDLRITFKQPEEDPDPDPEPDPEDPA